MLRGVWENVPTPTSQPSDLMPQFPSLSHEAAGSIMEITTSTAAERLGKGGFFCLVLASGEGSRVPGAGAAGRQPGLSGR